MIRPQKPASRNQAEPRIDGRSLRATGRTTQFTTRITGELQTEMKVFAAQHRLKMNDLLEQAFIALKKQMQK